MMKVVVFAILAASASAYVNAPAKPFAVRRATQLHESFGLNFAEDTYTNQPDLLKGEAEYKQWVNRIKDNNLVNRKYPVIRRVRELELLKATADAGILSKLEANGVDLKTIEKLLPAIEQSGLLSFVANNQQSLVNFAAPLLIEPAPILLPVVAGALGAGPSAFFLAAAATGGLEVYFLAFDVEVPLVGLPAGVVGGLILVPLTAVFAVVGTFFNGLKK